MEYMCNVANNFFGDLFMSVRQLQLYDFFARISRAFPLLNILNVISLHGQKKKLTHQQNEHKQTSSIIEYPHLMYLSLNRVYVDYIKQFLFESNTYLPYLNKLSVQYQDLIDAIENFTNNAEKVNCAKLKYIILFSKPSMYPENFHDYFPSLINKLLF
ncbi:unnamed protein product [Rotaria sordida]|uniref:Uncharacterized protein n=1 Tax=Rotaria sordida TaxID=392033 RepID=A0A815U0A6_9BILA|nr:unnamed protein product [Rotaria sordida]CAF1511058.1 unnamed protein product [Rotaria sordida]CAF1569756.1 unnamed protein product [Rotaria sordida]CAF1658574.1 unnamed protein product [Rotaria sordida]